MANVIEQSSDMVFEILTRTQTLKTLDQFKIVSKIWKETIEEASFVRLFSRRTANLYGHLLQDMRRCVHNTDFLSCNGNLTKDFIPRGRGITILATCNQGILCCQWPEYTSYRYFVYKPATKQWMNIPNPKLRYHAEGHAIVVLGSRPLRYKIVRLSRTRSRDFYKCEIFSSESMKWVVIQDLTLAFREVILGSCLSSPVTVGTSVHWLTSEENILMFNVHDESFTKFPIHNNDGSIGVKGIVNHKGKLGFTCETGEGTMELWVMKNREQMIWERKMVLNGSILEEAYYVGFCHDEIVSVKASRVGRPEIFQFRSDLEPIEGWMHMSDAPISRGRRSRVRRNERDKGWCCGNSRKIKFCIIFVLFVVAILLQILVVLC